MATVSSLMTILVSLGLNHGRPDPYLSRVRWDPHYDEVHHSEPFYDEYHGGPYYDRFYRGAYHGGLRGGYRYAGGHDGYHYGTRHEKPIGGVALHGGAEKEFSMPNFKPLGKGKYEFTDKNDLVDSHKEVFVTVEKPVIEKRLVKKQERVPFHLMQPQKRILKLNNKGEIKGGIPGIKGYPGMRFSFGPKGLGLQYKGNEISLSRVGLKKAIGELKDIAGGNKGRRHRKKMKNLVKKVPRKGHGPRRRDRGKRRGGRRPSRSSSGDSSTRSGPGGRSSSGSSPSESGSESGSEMQSRVPGEPQRGQRNIPGQRGVGTPSQPGQLPNMPASPYAGMPPASIPQNAPLVQGRPYITKAAADAATPAECKGSSGHSSASNLLSSSAPLGQGASQSSGAGAGGANPSGSQMSPNPSSGQQPQQMQSQQQQGQQPPSSGSGNGSGPGESSSSEDTPAKRKKRSLWKKLTSKGKKKKDMKLMAETGLINMSPLSSSRSSRSSDRE